MEDSSVLNSNTRHNKYEFGGPLGAFLMIIFFPIILLYVYIGNFAYDGELPWVAAGEGVCEFISKCVNFLASTAIPHTKVWLVYWGFIVFEGFCYIFLPGVYARGKPLALLNYDSLTYYCSGVWSLYLTLIVTAIFHVLGLFPLYLIVENFGAYIAVAILSSFIISGLAYFSALHMDRSCCMTGCHVYDFFMGAELNPRIFSYLDLKMFSEVRVPWFSLLLIALGACSFQHKTLGYVTPQLSLLLFFVFLYTNACCKGEELIVTSWDIFHEKWGFMLIFWNYAGVPVFYSQCIIYVALHNEASASSTPHSIIMIAKFAIPYLFVYWIWDTANSQKNLYRVCIKNGAQVRSTFPRLPWRMIHNPRCIYTGHEDSILVDGWFKFARKLNYTCDVYFAVTWAVLAGFRSAIHWLYPLFFVSMITHRTYRDCIRCRQKYGPAWEEYEILVPALFLPYFF